VTTSREVVAEAPSPKVHRYETTGPENPADAATNVTESAPFAGLIDSPASGDAPAPPIPAAAIGVAASDAVPIAPTAASVSLVHLCHPSRISRPFRRNPSSHWTTFAASLQAPYCQVCGLGGAEPSTIADGTVESVAEGSPKPAQDLVAEVRLDPFWFLAEFLEQRRRGAEESGRLKVASHARSDDGESEQRVCDQRPLARPSRRLQRAAKGLFGHQVIVVERGCQTEAVLEEGHEGGVAYAFSDRERLLEVAPGCLRVALFQLEHAKVVEGAGLAQAVSGRTAVPHGFGVV
jgi:hypothetical protein